jgi:(2S)-methylsuccinyl-CoA dehydrogenase
MQESALRRRFEIGEAMKALRDRLVDGVAVADGLVASIRGAVAQRVRTRGKIDRALIDAGQHGAHGLAWYATYAEVLRSIREWTDLLELRGLLSEVEVCIADVLLDDYLAQMLGGIAMSQTEFTRPADFDLPQSALGPISALVRERTGADRQMSRSRLAALLAESRGSPTLEATGLDAESDMIREQFRAFADAKVTPRAHNWHLENELIPLDLVEELAQLGVFGLTIPEEYGGTGLGKIAMCLVSEELSCGYLGVGSLATRSEIAAELIMCGGTEAQKRRWLPAIAAGAMLPTAVFTEPGSGSDLGSLNTRAVRVGDDFIVTGNKTWITHGARADLMTMLVRTESGIGDHRGLSILLAEKARGTDADPFPGAGMSGGEIPVLGYRGMKEYEIRFDGFRVPAANLLGNVGGEGFRQLMATFESARIQTAARAVGVAQAAMECALSYATDRRQFGQSILGFPRVSNKLALMAAEIAGVRQLTYRAARRKDLGGRCDLEAGTAKLLAARVAWSAADNALQIHGGNGFALEFPASRLLCDARILSVFEGSAEIQAQVIARRLLSDSG